MLPEVQALQALVATLKTERDAAVTAWDGLKVSHDAAVVRVGQLEAQIANAPPPPTGLQDDDRAALAQIATDIASVTQDLADRRVVNAPGN